MKPISEQAAEHLVATTGATIEHRGDIRVLLIHSYHINTDETIVEERLIVPAAEADL